MLANKDNVRKAKWNDRKTKHNKKPESVLVITDWTMISCRKSSSNQRCRLVSNISKPNDLTSLLLRVSEGSFCHVLKLWGFSQLLLIFTQNFLFYFEKFLLTYCPSSRFLYFSFNSLLFFLFLLILLVFVFVQLPPTVLKH